MEQIQKKNIFLNTLFTVSIRHNHFELKIKFFQEIDQKYVLERAASKFSFVQCCVVSVDARLIFVRRPQMALPTKENNYILIEIIIGSQIALPPEL
jgi:hypothetical protein